MGSFKSITFKAVSIVSGELHFMAQSTADSIKHAEGYLGHKLTGANKQDIMSKRVQLTKAQQADYKKCAQTLRGTMSNKFKAITLD